MEVLDLADVVLLGVGEDFEQVLWLETDDQLGGFCNVVLQVLQAEPADVLGHEHHLLILCHLLAERPPVPLLIIERVNELFISLQVVQRLSVLRNQIIKLLRLCLKRIEFRH